MFPCSQSTRTQSTPDRANSLDIFDPGSICQAPKDCLPSRNEVLRRFAACSVVGLDMTGSKLEKKNKMLSPEVKVVNDDVRWALEAKVFSRPIFSLQYSAFPVCPLGRHSYGYGFLFTRCGFGRKQESDPHSRNLHLRQALPITGVSVRPYSRLC